MGAVERRSAEEVEERGQHVDQPRAAIEDASPIEGRGTAHHHGDVHERVVELAPVREHPVFAEEIVMRENTNADHDRLLTSVRSARWKYVLTYDRLAGTVVEEAYDLDADPGEQHDLCAGKGRIDGLTFDAAFCRAVEQARDRIWGAAEHADTVFTSPYAGGRARVTSKRPAACGTEVAGNGNTKKR